MKPTNNSLTNSFLYKELFNKSFSVMLLIDTITLKIIDANPSACIFYGYTHEEITKLKISDINILSENEINAEIKNAKNKKHNYFNFKHKLADGTVKDVEVYSSLVNNNGNDILFSVIHDVTEKKELDRKTKESEYKYSQLVNNLKDCLAVYKVNEKGEIIIQNLNTAAEKLEKVKSVDIRGKKLIDVFTGAKKFGIVDAIKKVNKTGIAINLSIKKYEANDITSWRENHIYKIKTGEIIAVYRDLTDAKITNQKLINSEQKHRLITEAITDCIFIIDLDGKFTYLNKAFEEITKFKVKDFIGTHFIKQVCPEYKELILNNFKKGLKREAILLYEIEIFDKNNNRVPIELKVSSMYDDKGNIIGRTGIFRDITDRKLAIKEKQKNEITFKSIIENATDLIVLLDEKGCVKYVNNIAEKLTGYTSEEVINTSFAKYIAKEDVSQIHKILQKVIHNNETVTFESTLIGKNGVRIPFISTGKHFEYKGETVRMVIFKDISKLKQAHQKIIESESLLTEAEKIAKLGYWKIHHKTNTTVWSDEIFRIIDEKPQSFTPNYSRFIELIHPDDIEMVFNLNKTIKNSIEYRIITKKGKTKYVKEIWTTKLDKNSEPETTMGTVQDITKQKLNEITLKESEKRYKDLFYKSKDATFLLYNNKIVDCNFETAKILETNTAKNIIGKSPFNLSPKYQEDGMLSKEKALEEISKALKQGYNRFEWQHLSFKGNIIYVEVSLTQITIDNKKMLYAVLRNISKRKAAEKELVKLITAVEQTLSVVVITDTEGNIEYVNPAFTEITGYTKEEAIGQNPRILASGKTTKQEYKQLWDTIKSGKVWKGEFYNKTKSNTYYWEKVVISPVKNNNGKIINFIAIKSNITTQKEIEQKEKQARADLMRVNNMFKKQNIEIKIQNELLTQSKKELQIINNEFNAVINRSNAIFIEVDTNKKVVRWNRSAVKVTGILPGKIIGRSITDIDVDSDSDINKLIKKIINDGLEGKTVKEKEITFKSVKQEIQTILISSDAKLNVDNVITGVFIVAQDITTITNYNKFLELQVEDRTKELKEALHKEKELSELKSKFVSVVSHEFRTPLSAINFSANFINNYFEKLEKDKIKQKLKNIETQVKHMTTLLDDVLIMGRIQSKRGAFNPEIVNAGEYLKPIIEEVYISRNKTHNIIYSENVENPIIYVDKAQARNIFVNLLSNAIKFSPNSSEVYIKVEVFSKNSKITITDTGIGIKDTAEIFKPFVRGVNADNIQGTGLGLSIVKEAVKKHKGKINVHSKINEGTSIEVILPNKQETKN